MVLVSHFLSLALSFMSEQHFSKEKRVLMAMRKTLAKVVRDLTPSDSATKYPLTDETVEDIKMCFDLISSREREMAQEVGVEVKDRPRFIDETNTTTANVVSIEGLKAARKDKS